MKVRNLLLLLAFCCLSLAVQAQFVSTSAHPKREFRAAWIQAVNGQFRGIPTDRLKQILINQLNSLQGAGINAVIFQVRPEADALYASQYEPWSRFLTGVQGKAPEPYWDPMQFMIEECHKRSMEFHAWINPYRVKTSLKNELSPIHIYNSHPEWFVTYGDQLYFDPALPESRNHICKVITDIVSRYDAATGELLEIRQRIGILDRKLRVVNENTYSETEWFRWVLRAYQSVYGYEFQGDSLLIARINLLITFVDYMQDRWGRVPTDVELRKIVNVIVWNLWQMDGISGTIPFGKPKEEYHQFSLFDFVVADEPEKQDTEEPEEVYCRIYDWRSDKSLTYKSMKEGR